MSDVSLIIIEGVKITNPLVRKIHEQIQKHNEDQMRAFWVPHEIKLDKDHADFLRLVRPEKFYATKIITFFLVADDLIGENLGGRFINEVPIEASRRYLKFQLVMEDIHAQTYLRIFAELIKDKEERDKCLLEALGDKTNLVSGSAISEKIKWCAKWISSTAPLAERIVAMVFVELVLFSSSFAGIYWFKSRGLLPGLTYSNELIARDEGSHGLHGVMMYFILIEEGHIQPLPIEKIIEIGTSAVIAESAFVQESIPEPMLDMSAEKMNEYVRFVADVTFSFFHISAVYKAKNPFPFMDLISIVGKTDFFIRQVSEYSHTFNSYVPGDDQIDCFTLDESDL
jgi:ribonucleotide reductase beta subunit family protein with ferritin-like domain